MNYLEEIKNYVPCCAQEEKDQEVTWDCIEKFDDIFSRQNKIAHLTSSAFVVNLKRDQVLMVHHNIFNSWSWIGGHADGETDLLKVAVKELKEETGIVHARPISEKIFSLDILPVIGHFKRGEYISPHLHLSICFLMEVDESQPLAVKEDENSDIKWIPIEEVNLWSNEPHMHKVYEKLIQKISIGI